MQALRPAPHHKRHDPSHGVQATARAVRISGNRPDRHNRDVDEPPLLGLCKRRSQRTSFVYAPHVDGRVQLGRRILIMIPSLINSPIESMKILCTSKCGAAGKIWATSSNLPSSTFFSVPVAPLFASLVTSFKDVPNAAGYNIRTGAHLGLSCST